MNGNMSSLSSLRPGMPSIGCLDPRAEVRVAHVEGVALRAGVEESDHLLVVELEVERRVVDHYVRVLLREALEVGFDHLRLESPSGEFHGSLRRRRGRDERQAG